MLYIHGAAPGGLHKEVYFLYRGPKGLEWAIVSNVEVAGDAVTDLGQIIGAPVTLEEAQTIFGDDASFLHYYG